MISVTRLFRLGMRVAAWATPRVQEWHRQRHLNQVEGQRHLDARNWTEAEKHLSLALQERRHSAKRRVELLLGLAQAQRKQRKLTEAGETLQAAIAAAVDARNVPLHSRALDRLVDLQLDLGQYAEAEQTVARIEQLQCTQARPDRALLATCSRKLGAALLKSGRTAEAMQAFERAADLSEQAFGPAHVETANSLVELGRLYREQGNHPEAQRHLRRALEIHRGTLGADSHEATEDLHNLAASLEESGDLDAAAGELERLLALRTRQVGANPEQTAEAQVRLATLYLRARRAGPAKELLTHAIGVLERKRGPQLVAALEALAVAEDQMGHSDDAKRLRELAAGMKAQPNPTHQAFSRV
jgi:tetratricopeptide (TPR) repeat protein